MFGCPNHRSIPRPTIPTVPTAPAAAPRPLPLSVTPGGAVLSSAHSRPDRSRIGVAGIPRHTETAEARQAGFHGNLKKPQKEGGGTLALRLKEAPATHTPPPASLRSLKDRCRPRLIPLVPSRKLDRVCASRVSSTACTGMLRVRRGGARGCPGMVHSPIEQNRLERLTPPKFWKF